MHVFDRAYICKMRRLIHDLEHILFLMILLLEEARGLVGRGVVLTTR